MCTTIGRSVVNLLHHYDFIKYWSWKVFFISTLSIICTMANSTNFTYSRKLERNIQNVITNHNILVKGFISTGAPSILLQSISLWIWTCPISNQITSIQKLMYHNICFAKAKSYLKNLKVFGKRCITIWVHS
jgi:DMSO reductase anchor subunit